MTYAREQIHNRSGCGVEYPDNCNSMDDLLDMVEDDRAHAEAVKLREFAGGMVFNLLDPFSPQKEGWVRHIADHIDPYELRDRFWVHKVTGRVVIYRKEGTP